MASVFSTCQSILLVAESNEGELQSMPLDELRSLADSLQMALRKRVD